MKKLFVLFLAVFCVSCQQDLIEEPLIQNHVVAEGGTAQNSSITEAPSVTLVATANSGSITIGERFVGAYRLGNMRQALSDLKLRLLYDPFDSRVGSTAELWGINGYDLPATHRYVKIIPRSVNQLLELQRDPTLMLSPVPYDAPVNGTGTINSAPAEYDPQTGILKIPGSIQPQYAIIPIIQSLPVNVYCELLDNLFIPDMITPAIAAATKAPILSEDAAGLLIDHAMFIAGVKSREELMAEKKWRPSGSIMAFDDALQDYVGVPHVKVHIYSNVSQVVAYTKEDGSFTSDRYFKGAVNYNVEWGTDDFYVLNMAGEPAYYHCGKRFNNLNLKFKDGETAGIANTWRALVAHYYGSNNWERITNFQSYKGTRLPVYYRYTLDPDKFGYFQPPGGDAKLHVAIYGKEMRDLDDGEGVKRAERLSDGLIATTFHGMGHAAMYFRCKDRGVNYSDIDRVIKESWASFIEWIMLKDEYSRLGYNTNPKIPVRDSKGQVFYFNAPNSYNRQDFSWDIHWNTSKNARNYTPIYIDILDDSNQMEYRRVARLNYMAQPEDWIVSTNYTLLQNIFTNSYSLVELKTKLLQNAGTLGISTEHINIYFSFYGV